VGVFYAHSINIFDMLYWHVRSGGQSTGLIVMVVFGTQWGMSLFFFLAGASAWFALESRSSDQFIGERFKRLIIPFIVGFILLSPPQAYLFALSQGTYQGNLLQFIPDFFEHIQISWNPQWIAPHAHVQTWLVPGANHIQSYDVMGNVYVQRVAAFFTHVLGPATQR
jgi:fucose 4-O-acetylase-like acetyltransferase